MFEKESEELIAVRPAERRADARLLVYNRKKTSIAHSNVSNLAEWLREGDVVVLNNTRVDPARVEWKKPTGGAAELLLLRHLSDKTSSSRWEAVVSGRNLQIMQDYELPEGIRMKLLEEREGTQTVVELSASEMEIRKWLQRVGKPPIPPYIRSARKRKGLEEDLPEDLERYQTTFAGAPGAVAAPTAGLHFTPELLAELKQKKIETEFVTLAVGWGTFQPLTKAHFESNQLHPEWVEVSPESAKRLTEAKREGRRIVAVGTTVVRSLEWWQRGGGSVEGAKGWCDLFLYPPWQSHFIDLLMTNFHLPESSLLLLVAGFLGGDGEKALRGIYEEAIREKYRFYSYGDAMLVV